MEDGVVKRSGGDTINESDGITSLVLIPRKCVKDAESKCNIIYFLLNTCLVGGCLHYRASTKMNDPRMLPNL